MEIEAGIGRIGYIRARAEGRTVDFRRGLGVIARPGPYLRLRRRVDYNGAAIQIHAAGCAGYGHCAAGNQHIRAAVGGRGHCPGGIRARCRAVQS